MGQKPRQAEITLLLSTPNVLNSSLWAPFILIGEVSLLEGEERHWLFSSRRAFAHAPRVDRPPPALCYATLSSLPATQGHRSKDRED
jgi:hypothetical protein